MAQPYQAHARALVQALARVWPMSMTWLFFSLLFSVIGFAFFLYGKSRVAYTPLLCGVALVIFPYFVSDTIVLVAVGAALTVLPLLRRF